MYWTLFLTFLKIGVGTIGGGYAMLPLIQREVVDRGWLSKEDFIDLFSVAQSLPGIFAVNISIFVGYKLRQRAAARGAVRRGAGAGGAGHRLRVSLPRGGRPST